MAMLDYPYSTHFIGNMPANPVKVACGTMLRGPDLLANLRDAAGIVYNSTGLLTCFDLYNLYVECADPTGCGQGFDSLAWDYQVHQSPLTQQGTIEPNSGVGGKYQK
ncbi:hypothetical protein ATANTOWER_004970 [Ataeniobius toweri]|uniref:Uncharacterized protein n=1 Tax=Ataeniobius toweri TaxID=208326 RepID=A0ABU7B532_9TELE|nr:hypothetical protein [Ataeniobius toweri]